MNSRNHKKFKPLSNILPLWENVFMAKQRVVRLEDVFSSIALYNAAPLPTQLLAALGRAQQ
jgi:hypothetical protein